MSATIQESKCRHVKIHEIRMSYLNLLLIYLHELNHEQAPLAGKKEKEKNQRNLKFMNSFSLMMISSIIHHDYFQQILDSYHNHRTKQSSIRKCINLHSVYFKVYVYVHVIWSSNGLNYR